MTQDSNQPTRSVSPMAMVPGLSGAAPEKPRLTLGFIPLTDCAPLVVAVEKGWFARHGLEVTLSREASWANIRDKVAVGALDGAHMLAGMPIAATLGLGGLTVPMVTGLSLDLNGNAITVSTALYRRMVEADPAAMAGRPVTARALKAVIDADRAAGRPPLTFATVFPVSTHTYQIRYWMASAGIDPDDDVRLAVIPPPGMVVSLEAGRIDGYCVGEPWNARAVDLGIGRVLITSHELWNNGPEKVLGVTRAWAERHPNSHRALIMALIEACRWMDLPENRHEVAELIARPPYVDAPAEVVAMSMAGRFRYGPDDAPCAVPDFHVFHRYAANFPWCSHAEWLICQMIRWGQIDRPLDIRAAAAAVYRPDLYRAAAAGLGLPCPAIERKREGGHAAPWRLGEGADAILLGPDRFFDGRTFDPDAAMDYLRGFAIHHARLPFGADAIPVPA